MHNNGVPNNNDNHNRNSIFSTASDYAMQHGQELSFTAFGYAIKALMNKSLSEILSRLVMSGFNVETFAKVITLALTGNTEQAEQAIDAERKLCEYVGRCLFQYSMDIKELTHDLDNIGDNPMLL